MRADFLQKFSSRLSAVRIAFGAATGQPELSRGDFAVKLGVEMARYRRWERGEMEPPLQVLAAIRHITGISLDYLIGDTGPGAARPSGLDDISQTTFAERVRCVRDVHTHETAAVAEAMGVSLETYERWEDGREPMPEAKQAEFAHRFNATLEFLQQGILDEVEPAVLIRLRAHHLELWRSIDTDKETVPGTMEAKKGFRRSSRS